MGVFDNLTSQVSSEASEVLGKPQSSAQAESFNRDFRASSFDSFGGDVDTDQYYEVARFQVPASTEYSWGYGSAKNPENQGYLYVDLQTSTPAAVEGSLQIVQTSPTGRKVNVVAEYDTTTLDGSKTDRNQRIPLPEQVSSDLVTQDSYLVVRLKADSAATVDETESDVIFPVTEYDLG